ncbi:unnamed protein product, partial [Ixodes hexagonus]
MEGPWPPLLLALLLLPASLALTLHHRSDTADAYIITSDAEDPSSSVVAEPVQTPALTKGQSPLTPPARGSHAARQERTSANNASNEATSAPGTLEQDQLDFELSSLQNEDGQGPAVVRNESLEQLRESEEAAAYAVPEDNVQPAAQNETVANSTLEPTPVSPVLTIPWGNGLSYEPSESSSVTTSSSAEEDALSLKISGHSSQDQVRNVDALTGEVTSTSLDNGTLDESILKTTTFSNGIWVSNVSLGMTTTEAVAAQNLAVSQGNEWTPEVLDVSIEDLGNESHEQLANTTTEVLYETSQLEVPPVTTSERPDSREETTVRHTTEKREETTVLTIDDSSEAIQTSQTAEVETHNSTFASAEEHLGLEVRTISTDIAIEPALNHTEVEEQPSPAVTSPAESIMEESEVLFPSQPTTSYNSTTGTDEALTKVPATDSDIIESVSLQGETTAETDSPTATEGAASPATSTVGQSPPRPASCVPLEPPKRPSHEFRLVFSTSSEFSWEQVEALERRIQSFIRDTPCPRHFARTAFALGPPHTLSWTDPSANSTWCDRDSIDALLRTMRSDSGHPTPAITHAFYPEFRISSVELRLRGACVAGASAFPVVAVTVGVALSAALLAGLLTLLWKFLRMSPRSRRLDVTPAPPKDSFDLKQRRPILLPG